MESLRSSEPVGLLTPNPQRLGSATRKDASPTAPNTNLKPNPEWYNGIDALPGHENPPKANLPWPREGSIAYGTNLARSAHKGENPRHADGGKPLTQTRPAKFDKVAYMAKYMARYRAEIKSGKRVPKRKGER